MEVFFVIKFIHSTFKITMKDNPTLAKFKTIKTFLFDVDGVMTDGTFIIQEDGQFLRKMNAQDGFMVKTIIEKGYQVAILTGGRSEGVRKRFQKLGVKEIYLGLRHKIEAFEELMSIYRWDKNEILYMGDDLPDYEVLQAVGLPCCPANAVPEIKGICEYVSPYKGGEGCVRDVIEKVLRLNDQWDWV